MNMYDAAKILGLTGQISDADLKLAFRRAVSKYHPDRNPAGLEMMKAVNEAYATLKDRIIDLFETKIDEHSEQQDYGSDLNDALNAIIHFVGLDIEVCGSWVWVGGDTKPFKQQIKEAGFKWAAKKKKWFFRPEGYKSFSRGKYTMGQIRDTFGSDKVNTVSRTAMR